MVINNVGVQYKHWIHICTDAAYFAAVEPVEPVEPVRHCTAASWSMCFCYSDIFKKNTIVVETFFRVNI